MIKTVQKSYVTICDALFEINKKAGTSRMSGRFDTLTDTGKINVDYRCTPDRIFEFAIKILTKYKDLRIRLYDNEPFVLFGKRYRFAFSEGKSFSLQIIGEKAYFTKKEGADEQAVRAYLLRFMRSELKIEIALRMPIYERLTGLKCEKVLINNAVSAWATCRYDKAIIKFSSRLAQRPLECLDMVIVHELGHLLYHNHGKDFQAYMAKYYPDYKRVTKLLNSASQ